MVELVDPTITDVDAEGPSGRRHQPRLITWLAAAIAAVGAMLVVGDLSVVGGPVSAETLANPEAFRAWVEGRGAWGPIGYLLTQAAQVVVVPIPGTLFPPVGALAFGPWPALALSLAGMALGSAVVFLVARRWGRPLAIRLAGAERVQRYQTLMTARGGLLIWLVFLLPFLPDDAVCALAGLSGIGFGRFMLIATVGRIPAVAAACSPWLGWKEPPHGCGGSQQLALCSSFGRGRGSGPPSKAVSSASAGLPELDPEETGAHVQDRRVFLP